MFKNDAQEIKRLADILTIAEALGIEGASYSKNIKCPFHDDSTPSFRLYPPSGSNGGSFKCFSDCGANDDGSDVFALVMKYQNSDFPTALKFVAQLVGYRLSVADRSNDPLFAERKALGRAQYVYRSDFQNSPGEEYLLGRGFCKSTLDEFDVGFAQPRNALLTRAEKHHEPLRKLGLLKINEGDGSLYDLLRNRVTIPIHNMEGHLVGFGARDISGHSPAKYMNSPDSELFKKSSLLFGYHRYAKRSSRILITEGYLDVMALHQVGFKEAVCAMGVSINTSMLDWLTQHHTELFFFFDGDAAGLNAARRAASAAIEFTDRPVSFRFCFLPNGEDPCDVAIKHGKDGIAYYLDQSWFLSDFLVEEVKRSCSGSQAIETKQVELAELSSLVERAPPGLFKDLIALQIKRNSEALVEMVSTLEIESFDPGLLGDVKQLLLEKYGHRLRVNTLARGGIRVSAASQDGFDAVDVSENRGEIQTST